MAFSAAPRGPQTARFSLAWVQGRSGRNPRFWFGISTAVNCLNSSALIALSPAFRSVTALSGFSEGAVPRLNGLQSCPASHFAGILPSFFARAFVILFRGAVLKGALVLPPVLVDEAAHPDVHHHPQRQKHEKDGRPAVTHERQRDSRDRHKADHHANVD
jgi:hypothetical protein